MCVLENIKNQKIISKANWTQRRNKGEKENIVIRVNSIDLFVF